MGKVSHTSVDTPEIKRIIELALSCYVSDYEDVHSDADIQLALYTLEQLNKLHTHTHTHTHTHRTIEP